MRYPAEVLSAEEVRALVEACGNTWAGRRDAALIVLMYRSGLRVGEALALRACDIDAQRSSIRVLNGKGGKARTVGIDASGLRPVMAWAADRHALGFDPGGPLFCTRTGRAVTQGFLRRRLPELARRAGIHKRVHAHGLRHTHAAELRAEGVDVAIIRRQLGHESLLTTIRYLDHLAAAAVVEVIAGRAASRS